MKPNFCAFCGVQLTPEQQEAVHPHCEACGTTHWQNPRPVAVLLQPVLSRVQDGEVRRGLAIGRRSIEPFIGEWCLPAGFVEPGHSAEETAVKELEEELGLITPLSGVRVVETKTIGTVVLILCITESLVTDFTHEPFTPNDEVSERRVIWQPEPLCFPYHTDVVTEWFKGLR